MAAKTIVTGNEKSSMFRSYGDDDASAAGVTSGSAADTPMLAATKGRGASKDIALMQARRVGTERFLLCLGPERVMIWSGERECY